MVAVRTEVMQAITVDLQHVALNEGSVSSAMFSVSLSLSLSRNKSVIEDT